MVTVSVIMPSFNSSAYIAESIESVLQQTFRDFEIIIVDDGSNDGTEAIIEQYGARFPGTIRIFHQQNRGPGAARNTGIRNARGRYIAFNDADDLWLPRKLEKQIAVLERDSNIGLVYCDTYYVDKNRKIMPERKPKCRLPRGQVTLDLFHRYFMYTSSIVARWTSIQKAGFYREDIFVGEDYHYFIRLSYICEIELIDEKLLEKRVLSESLSSRDDMLNAMNDLMIYRDFLKEHPEFYARHRAALVNRLYEYNFNVGYRLLKKGRNILAMYYLFGALRYRRSLKAVKCLLLTPFPYDFIQTVKVRILKRTEAVEEELASTEKQ